MSTHNIGFYEDLTKIIFKLSSNTHINSSAGEAACLLNQGLWVLSRASQVFWMRL